MRGDADKDKATPRPWRLGVSTLPRRDNRGWISIKDDKAVTIAEVLPREGIEANAALIVAAVNSFDAHRQLAEAFRNALITLNAYGCSDEEMSIYHAALAALDAMEKP